MTATILPFPPFDAVQESRTAAANEACAGQAMDCSPSTLCPECAALAVQIQKRLERAYLAGQQSMQSTGD